MVRFSTFATVTGRNGHTEAVATCPLFGDERTSLQLVLRSEFDPERTIFERASGHAAGNKTADAWMAVDVVLPDHRAPGAVRLRDDGTVGHHDPFAVDADAIMPAVGFPIRIGDYVSVGISTALPKFALQAFEPLLQRRIGVATVIAPRRRRREHHQTKQQRRKSCRKHLLASADSPQPGPQARAHAA
jgi:hypothetical protein